MIRVLFVCLGNICRSPLAQAIFDQQIANYGLNHLFESDSAGTAAYHVGDPPDQRSRANAQQNGLQYTHSARQLNVDDFADFQYIIAMDQSNYTNIMSVARQHDLDHSEVHLMRKFEVGPQTMEVPDPYYGGPQGFQDVYDILQEANKGLIDFLRERHS